MTYEELCNKNIGDMNKDELFEFSIGLLNEVHDYEKEIQKLNNIIDELEKYLKEYSQDLEFRCYANMFIEKLKELKGDNINEENKKRN